MDIVSLISNPGVWTIVAVALAVVYLERKRLLGLFGNHTRQRLQERQSDQAFDDQLRQQLLESSEYNRELVNRFVSLYNTERDERRALMQQLICVTGSTEKVATQAVEVMQDFADISRLQADRLTARDQEMCEVLRELRQTTEGIGFVLTQLYFRGQPSKTFPDLMAELEENRNGTQSAGVFSSASGGEREQE